MVEAVPDEKKTDDQLNQRVTVVGQFIAATSGPQKIQNGSLLKL
jgi:hypothetical protein